MSSAADPEGTGPRRPVDEFGAEEDGGAPLDAEDERILAGIGDNPLLERVQKQLKDQLQRRLDRVEAELRGKREEAERFAKEREAAGVELYGIQQQLVKAQGRLQTTNSNLEVMVGVRERAEEDLEKFRAGLEERRRQLTEEQGKVVEARAELDGVMDTLRQVAAYDEEMAAEIALTRRAAYKAEEQVSDAEKGKREQDVYIDEMNERIRRLGDQLALYDAQLRSQQEESAAAEATLRSAEKEMEVIKSEKIELMSRWRSTLAEIRRRDEALEEVRKEIRAEEEAFRAMNAEEANVRKALAKTQEEHAKLLSVLDRERGQLRTAEASLVTMARQKAALEERQEMLASSLEAAEGELARLRVELERLLSEIRDLDNRRALVEKQRQGAEGGVGEKESAQVTARKAARNLARGARRVLAQVHAKEQELATVENQMARVKVETLSTEAHVEALRAELGRAEKEVKDKEQLVARQQLEVRQRHDEIEKKMAVVDRLNRKHERLTADLPEEEHMGPLHATVHNTNKEIAAVRAECEELQRRWLARQTTLVAASADADEKAAQARELVSQRVLLEQKRVRIEKAVDAQKEETTDLQKELTRMREDMARINALISKNEGLANKLAETTYVAEKEFGEELRELEKESATLEARLAGIKEEKARILEEVLEAEQQAALLEKKIELEKETQAALDPSVGKSEVHAMEKEIHRMRLRLEAHQRKQEALVKELERAVAKREDIAIRYEKKRRDRGEGANRDPKDLTRGAALRRKATLRREAKTRKQQEAELLASLEAKAAELEEAERQLTEAQKSVADLEAEVDEVQAGINAASYDRQRETERIASLRTQAAALLAFARGAGADEEEIRAALQHFRAAHEQSRPPTPRDPLDPDAAAAPVEAAEAEAEAERTRIQEMLEQLIDAKPDLADLLDRVMQLTQIVN